MGSDVGSAACRMASILDIAATCASKNKMPAAHQTIFLLIAISPKLAPGMRIALKQNRRMAVFQAIRRAVSDRDRGRFT